MVNTLSYYGDAKKKSLMGAIDIWLRCEHLLHNNLMLECLVFKSTPPTAWRRLGVDLRAVCLGVVVGAAATALWTFGPPLRPRLGGVLSSATGEREAGVLELRPLAFRSLRWSGWAPGSCWAHGLWQADQTLLDAVDRSGLI